MRYRWRAPAAVLTVLLLAGCTTSFQEGADLTPGASGEPLELVAERLDHFQGFAADGVLVAPFLAQGTAEVPSFEFDVEEGYVLTIYCLPGTAAVDVRIDGEPSHVEPLACDGGQITMARNAPGMSAAESDILISADDGSSYWLAAVTRSTEDYRASADAAASGNGGAVELAVARTCAPASEADCTPVNDELVTVPAQFVSVGVDEASALPDGANSEAVHLTLDRPGTSTLQSLSAQVADLGEEGRLLLKVGDEVVSAIRVPAPIDGSEVQIALPEELAAQAVVERIREG